MTRPRLRPSAHGARVVLGALAIAAVTLASASATAAPPGDDADAVSAAKALYDQATTAMDAHDYATACPKLEQVVKLAPQGIGGRITLGECYEAAGKLASAYAAFALAETMAGQAKQAERVKKAHARAAALRPKLARLTIDVAEPLKALDGLDIRCDGAPVDAPLVGTPVPVDRGSHVVTVKAAGKQTWEKRVEIAADGGETTITVDALPAIAAAPPPPNVAPEEPKEAPRAVWGPQRIAGLAIGAAGVVGVGVGAGLGGLAIAKNNASNANGHCRAGNHCDATGVSLRSASITAGNASTALFVVGGALVVTGVVLFVTAPKPAPTEVALGPGGVVVRGGW